ncbi:putative proton-dependent oligopeptide transporter family, major facilitator superfamily [Rosa chinensis]|uniref:Putative proton-dependent oligopeptide transporter family, major facilitator superfamily n=1 Tax=Rosa chinensis TaxID=74649 RepID=A0A2P6S9L8_ROSCH|nr:protein NRT1/ PTR FAMILY 5.4 isoform X1 [Rosa chinensis]PRQ55390.1 putative proton-dependent oligopeptide transporter family, major facilitator superfamily [Rosa chinensis]
MDSFHSPKGHLQDEDVEKNISSQKKSSRGGWSAAIFIIFVEMAERFSFFGLAGNLITYLTNELHEPIPTAAKNVNTWIGVSSLLPILGAFIADSYLGRFNTILVSSIIYCMAMSLLTVTVSAIPLHLRKLMFFVALYLLSLGLSGHKPCVQTFAADQFSEDSAEERKAKSSFFNWWYLGIVVGGSSAVLVVIYIQDNVSWAAGFGILTGSMVVALILFLLGIKKYRRQGPLGSPFTKVAQVFVAALRKQHMEVTTGQDLDEYCQQQPHTTLVHTNQFRFLDKAMVIDHQDASSETTNPWRLCSLNQVEQVKLLLRLIPIWMCCLMFAVVQSFVQTFFTKQGSTMIRSIGSIQLPQASLQIFVGLTIVVAIPIYDCVFVPIARKFTGHSSGITILQRIGTGLLISIMSMVVAAVVEAKRVKIVRDHNLLDNPKAIVPMRVWWLIPQYMICGLSDAFAFVGMQELFYDQMPEAMRSLGAAFYLSVVGVGFFLSNGIITLVQAISSKGGEKWITNNINRSHLDYFYSVIAGLSALNFCLYVWTAKGFLYKRIEAKECNKEIELN